MHAGGVLIAPGKLTDFCPLYQADGDDAASISQFDKDDVEAIGLVKFDFLGLRNLTIIDLATQYIKRLDPAFDTRLEDLAFDDPAAYKILKDANTTAIFQVEGDGMKKLLKKLQPDRFEDIIAALALYRPGPLGSGMVDDFILRKKGQQRIDYFIDDLKQCLEPTYGVIVYQEQVMQIAQIIGGYTLGGADLLRRAMGKKKPEEMAKQRSVFLEGSIARGVPQAQAAMIFDLMEKFAGYGFNKSHSAAYALLSFQTAYLKAHYPAAFMAAVLSADMDHTDKVVTLKDECDRMGLKVLAPDVNASGHVFEVADPSTVRYGLGAIKGVGQSVVEALVEERTARGPFGSLDELCRRIDLNKLNRRVLEAMIRSGSLDSLGVNRATLMARRPAAVQLGEQATRAVEAGQVDLFGLSAAPAAPAAGPAASTAGFQPEWSEAIRLAGERETLGLYLTGHPINRFERDLARFVSGRIADLLSDRPPPSSGNGERAWTPGKPATVAGYIHELRKRGTRMSAILDDRTGRIEVTFFDEVFQQHRELIVKDALVVVEGSLRFDEFSDGWRLAARRVVELDRLREQQAQRVVISWPRGAQSDALLGRLAELLSPARPGPCSVAVRYAGEKASAALELGPDWRVRATRTLLDDLERLVGPEGVRVVYGPPAGTPSSATG
jgi:DNA polymerase-3 subunit alpha